MCSTVISNRRGSLKSPKLGVDCTKLYEQNVTFFVIRSCIVVFKFPPVFLSNLRFGANPLCDTEAHGAQAPVMSFCPENSIIKNAQVHDSVFNSNP